MSNTQALQHVSEFGFFLAMHQQNTLNFHSMYLHVIAPSFMFEYVGFMLDLLWEIKQSEATH